MILQDNLVLSTKMIMSIGHRKDIRKLTFRALALRGRASLRGNRSGERLTLETSASESLYKIYSVDETKLFVIPPPTQHHSFFRNVPPLLDVYVIVPYARHQVLD